MSDLSIGVDIGLDNYKFGIWKNNKLEILPNFNGEYLTPSIVTFSDNRINIGKENYKDDNKYKKKTIYDINKIIGKKYNDKELKENMKIWPFKIEKDLETNKPLIVVEYKKEIKKYFPEEILSMIFYDIKSNIEGYIKKIVKNIVLTVPLYFNELQKEAYINSAKISGLNILKLIKTTSAAAFTYYDINKMRINKTKKNILVFDFGITFEISIFSIDENLIEEKASYYDINYGSNFILNELVELCINDFKINNGIDIHGNERAIKRLKRECVNLIQNFSYNKETNLSIKDLYKGYYFNKTITIKELNINSEKIIESIKIVLTIANLKKENIDDIFFTGGFSYNSIINDCVLNFFNKKKHINDHSYDAAAYGTIIQSSIINKQYYNNNLTLLELDSSDNFSKEKTDLKVNKILQYLLDKLNKEMIDLKKEIIEYENFELNEAKILLSELDENIENDNKDLESIILCDKLIEKVKKWIKKMKKIEFETKISKLEIELKKYKHEKKLIEQEKKLIENEKKEVERNYKLMIEQFKKLKK